jgi:hypothetical protein
MKQFLAAVTAALMLVTYIMQQSRSRDYASSPARSATHNSRHPPATLSCGTAVAGSL